MTRDEILKMEPGRELDALVAEKVMGHTVSPPGVVRQPQVWSKKKDGLIELPYYSTDISAAWEVVEKCDKLFPCSLFKFVKKNGEKGWGINWCLDYHDCESCEETCEDKQEVEASTAPEAICKASILCLLEGDK